MELKNDLTLPLLSLLSNYVNYAFFDTSVGCEIGCVGTTGSNNVLYISVRVTSTIKFNINENFRTWMLDILDRSN